MRSKALSVTVILVIGFSALFLFTTSDSFGTTENEKKSGSITYTITTRDSSETTENEKKSGSGFNTYTNTDFNIKIQYPKNWEKSETDLAQNVIVQFLAPDTKDVVQPAGVLIAEYNMPNGTSLDGFVNYFFKDRYTNPTDYKLISSSDAILAAMNAKQFVMYDYDKSVIPGLSGSTSKVMRVLAIDNNTGSGHAFKYWSSPGLYNKYLKTAQKIIDSFEVIDTSAQSEQLLIETDTQSASSPKRENLEFTDLNNKFVSKWGTLGSGEGQFNQPVDMAVNSGSGLVYVADLQNNRIQIFDADHNLVSQWGSYGTGDAQFIHPGSVSVSPWDEIFVSDIDNGRIQRFDLNGTFISKFGKPGIQPGQFNSPGDIAFDPNGKFVFISDTDNNRIQKFDSNGTFVKEWGSLGTRNGQFNHPSGISYDAVDNFLYVTDTNNDRIQKFDSDGKFILKWGKSGNSDNDFKRPTSVIVDNANRIVYVADTNNHRIQKFDLTGKFISSLGSQGVSNGQFNRPTGLEFESPNTLYVVDNQNNNIQVFSGPVESDSFSSSNEEFSSTSERSSSSNEQSSANEQDQEINSEMSSIPYASTPIDISTLPETITASESGSDNELVLLSAVSDTEVLPVNDEFSVKDYSFELSEWNPKMIFQFSEGSDTPLINIKQILVGKIKQYSSPEDILKDATLWQKVPLNQEVVLKLPSKGINFMIVQAQFANGVTGIYSGMFDLQSFLNKSSDAEILKDDLKEDRDLKVMKSIHPNLNKDIGFWQVAQEITCNDLKDFGFESCQ